jgi:hypothetical protein
MDLDGCGQAERATTAVKVARPTRQVLPPVSRAACRSGSHPGIKCVVGTNGLGGTVRRPYRQVWWRV